MSIFTKKSFNTVLTRYYKGLLTFVTMKGFTLYIVLLIGLIGCQNNTDKNQIFFGGEIINPKSNFVLLMQNENVLDTIFLKKDNTFGKYISNITSGLYSFKHGYEFQYIYLVPKDSLRIRLNTWDFDNTLVFDGKGSERNELLLDIFKGNESTNNNFYQYASLNEEDFLKKTALVTIQHTKLAADFTDSNPNETAAYQHLIDAAINYPIYRLKELYPYWHQKISKDSTFVLSKEYYDFRANTSLNDSLLSNYYAYQNFITTYLYKKANKANSNKGFDTNFRTLLLESIASEIKISKLKNQLLYNEIYTTLFDDSCEATQEQLHLFFDNSTDSIANNKIRLLIEDKKRLPVGDTFPNFTVTDNKGKETSIKNLIEKKNTALIYWSSLHISADYLNKRIRYLQTKFPSINFIVLNIDSTRNKLSFVTKTTENQYYIKNDDDESNFTKSGYTRTVIINSQGRISSSFTLLTNASIESQLGVIIASN